jgi:hypothetical protein
MESVVSDIPAGDGKIANLFFSVDVKGISKGKSSKKIKVQC